MLFLAVDVQNCPEWLPETTECGWTRKAAHRWSLCYLFIFVYFLSLLSLICGFLTKSKIRFLMINKHLIVVIAIATYPKFRHKVDVVFFLHNCKWEDSFKSCMKTAKLIITCGFRQIPWNLQKYCAFHHWSGFTFEVNVSSISLKFTFAFGESHFKFS